MNHNNLVNGPRPWSKTHRLWTDIRKWKQFHAAAVIAAALGSIAFAIILPSTHPPSIHLFESIHISEPQFRGRFTIDSARATVWPDSVSTLINPFSVELILLLFTR